MLKRHLFEQDTKDVQTSPKKTAVQKKVRSDAEDRFMSQLPKDKKLRSPAVIKADELYQRVKNADIDEREYEKSIGLKMIAR